MRSGPTTTGAARQTHPQYHLKLLLDRIGVGRGEVQALALVGPVGSSPARGRAVANAMTAADFSDKWRRFKPAERRLSGIRAGRAARSGGGSAGDRAGAARGA